MGGVPQRVDAGEATVEGVVLRLQGRAVLVRIDGEPVRCHLRKSLFRSVGKFTGPVAVGDHVRVSRDAGGAVVEEVLPRKGYLSRLHRASGLEQVIVANADQAAITVSVKEPELRPRLIDRLLVAAERGGMQGLILLTKMDLLDDRSEVEGLAGIYRDLGYAVVMTSVRTGEGIAELRDHLRGRTTVFSGQSGVGKSTLLNQVQPGLGLKTQEVSSKWRKGRHTTTAVHLIPLEIGGYVVDTPGIRSFSIAGLEPSDIGIFFRDFTPHLEDCRLPGCTHRHEPGCAVRKALEAGAIHPHRYEAYLRILDGLEEDEGA